MSELQKIGLIGAGLMGKGIGKTLLEKGFPVAVFAHTNRGPIDDLIERGATEVATIAELAAASQVIITCLPSIPSVHAVFEGPDGILENAASGTAIIDTTTSDPELTKVLAAQAAEKGLHLVDAPLLGGPKMTWEGTISIVVGGDDAAMKVCQNVLDSFAAAVFHAGGPGSGHTAKLINNAVTLTNSAILYESFTVAQKMGVDLDTLYKVMDASMASSKRLHVIAPALKKNDHTKTFAVSTATKDVVLYSGMTTALGVPSLVGDATRALYQLACGMGYGEENVTRIATALAKLGGTSFGDE
ncbi:MAG: NAD(P)-dependent oxidoreductase [Rhodospirillales bacterium]|nr:NAD(P)-dependent oxidoreductase [Rhodospirillales bacterium]